MGINSEFQIAGGSVIGTDHVLEGKPNQDAFVWSAHNDCIIAVVCDGCGGAKHSEVGSKVGARIIVKLIEEQLRYNLATLDSPHTSFLEKVRQDVLAQLRILTNAMGNSFSQTVADYFLFTIIGFLITPFRALIFSIGDGVFIVNGEITTIGPFPDNEPPYISYGLTGSKVTDKNPEFLKFWFYKFLQTEDLNSVLIGCDGVKDLIEAEEAMIPGRNEVVGPISQFWKDDGYFKNPFKISRKLNILNKPSQEILWDQRKIRREKGLLHDDTTFVVARRTPENF